MRRLVLVCLLCVLVAVAGCVGGQSGGTPTPTRTPADVATESPNSTAVATETATVTATDGSLPERNATAEYVVRAGDVPEEFASLNLSFEVRFAERYGEIDNCVYPEIIGPNEPTPTAHPAPEGECRSVTENATGGPLEVDLAAIEGNRTLGTVSGPAYPRGGQALLVMNASGRLENGTQVDRFFDEYFVVDRARIDADQSGEHSVVTVGAREMAGDGPIAYTLTVDGERARSFGVSSDD